jgi:DNA-binding MarR family transcriptional regulator
VPTHGKPDDVWSEFVVAILRLNGLIMRAGEGIARPIGQSSARWQVLGRAFEPQTVARMANDMGHARQSVQRVADALVSDGLVVYRAHPSDRRTKLVELTPQGLDVLTRIYRRQSAWSEHVVARLGAAELAQVTAALDGIGTALESEIAAGAAGPRALDSGSSKQEE